MRDARVETAISHWAPRFVENRVPVGDFQLVADTVERWEDWCDAWMARGAVHEELAAEARERDRLRSAGVHLATAAVCHHFGKFLFVQDPVTMRAAHERAVACRTAALPLLDPPGERVEVPFEGTTLPGNLRRPRDAERPPVVIMFSGLDSAKEESWAYEDLFLERGLATFAFDGPGQGESEYDLPIRGDSEAAAAAVVDALQERDDLDGDRIGVWGVSLGGYYAPRAAANEPRLRACISLSGPFDWGEVWDDLPGLTRAAFTARSHSGSEEEARERSHALSLVGQAERITCPLYVVAGGRDRLIPASHPRRLAAEASGPTELLVVEDGNHVVNNRAHEYRYRSADWMAEQLAAV